MAAGIYFNFAQLTFTAIQQIGIGPIVLYQVSGTSDPANAADLWFQLLDSAAAPVLGDVPKRSYLVRIGANYSITLDAPPGDKGQRFELGCFAAWSSTRDTYTPVGGVGTLHADGRTLA